MKNAKKARALKNRNAIVDTTSENIELEDMDITTLKGVSPPGPSSQGNTKTRMPSDNKTLLVKDFDVQANVFLENIEEIFTAKKRAIEMQYRKMLLKIQPEILDLPFGDYLKLRNKVLQSNKTPNATTVAKIIPISATPAPKPTPNIQSPNISSSQIRKTVRVSRSLKINSESGHEDKAAKTAPVTEQQILVQKEPEGQLVVRKSVRTGLNMEPRIILTKFDVNKPVNPARWPALNELSVSLKGSPLVAPTTSTISMINLNIPLQNGHVMAIFPHSMDHLTQIPEVSEDVLNQLNAIEHNIGIVKRLCMQHRKQAGLPEASTSTAMTPVSRKK